MRLKKEFQMILVFALFFIFGNVNAQQWAPLGNTIADVNSSDFGYDVALSSDGSVAIVGIPYFEDFNKGGAMVYSLVGSDWVQLGSTIEGDDLSDRLGYSVAINAAGTIIAMSLPGPDNPTIEVGKVKIYELKNNNWVQKGSDILSSGGFEFGWEIAMNDPGDVIGITSIGGATGGDVIYEWSGGDWKQKGQLFAESGDFSPFSIDLSGDGNDVVFGSPNLFGLVEEPGSVYVYHWSGTAWVQVGSKVVGAIKYNDFGRHVAISSDGQQVAIGIPKYNDGTNKGGAAKVFELVGATWKQVGATLLGELSNDEFGSDVKLSSSGKKLVVSAIKNDGAGVNSGQVRVFEWDATSWNQIGADIEGSSFAEGLGASIDISSAGDIVLASAPKENLVKCYKWNTTTAILESKDIAFSYGPNPTKDNIHLKFEKKQANISIELLDIAGHRISSWSFDNATTIDLPLPSNSGFYFLNVSADLTNRIVIPIVKE